MTPEQKKSKEIVEKYYRIVKYYERAKACAIEEVKAILEELPELVYGVLQDAPHQKIAVDNPRIIHWKTVLTEIEKL